MSAVDWDDDDPATAGWLRGALLRNPANNGWLGSALPRPPSPDPSRDVLHLGWRGLQALAPNITSLLAGEPAPPLPNLPDTPQKVPSTEDPRPFNAALEALQLGTNFLPGGFGGGTAVRAGVRAAEAMPWMTPFARSLPRQAASIVSETEVLASKSARLYNPPNKPPRSFEADYSPAKFPEGPPVDATGRLTHDSKGRELVAQYRLGRRTVGGPDEALAPAEFDALAEKGLGRRYQVVPASALPRNTVGVYNPNTGGILVYRGLPAETIDRVAAHEVGHGVNDKVGEFVGLRYANQIPITKKMEPELRVVFNDLNNADLAAARAKNPDINPADVKFGTGVTPETFGYRGPHVDAEYMAEAFRAAGVNPNYMKTVGPNVYRQLQDFFNEHPRFKHIIQFNTLAGPAFLGGIDPGSLPIPRQSAPVLS